MSLSDRLSIAGLIVSVLSLLVGTFVTVIVYQLSRKLDFRTRMHTWDELRDTIRKIAAEMHDEGLNTDVLLLNADRYEKDYNGGNRFTRHGYLQLRAEYIEVHDKGLALLRQAVGSWIDGDGRRVLHKTDQRAENVIEAGFVPFEHIEHIDPDGNDYKNAPLIYVHFRGRGRSPYVSYTYHESTPVPMGPRGRPFYPRIHELGTRRLSRAEGFITFCRTWWRDRKMRRVESRMRRQLDG